MLCSLRILLLYIVLYGILLFGGDCMSDLNTLYNNFNEKIKLTSSKTDSLKRGRDAIREKIKSNFSDNGRNKPKFRMQGSFAMKTTINPIGEDEYDLDDGVYLQGYGDLEQTDWPEADDTHDWVIQATDGHTKSDPENKTSCVRVRYEAGYHIDLPIYIVKDEICYLADKNQGWIESDPKAFKDWFISYVRDYPLSYGEQLRRTVRYLKAWRDYCGVDIASITLTILATNHFSSYSGRDDKAVAQTVDNIYTALSSNFSCLKPVTPGEELLGDYTSSEKDDILDAFKDFSEKAQAAVDEANEKSASELMRGLYGSRFPLGKDTTANAGYAVTSKPGVIGNDGRSA